MICFPFLPGNDSSSVGVAVGIVLALIIVAAIIVSAVWFMRKRRMMGHKSSGGVAFENPSYLREVNMDHIHVSCVVKSYIVYSDPAICCCHVCR
jgi:hypothetical protein